jgi:hypothetical protein
MGCAGSIGIDKEQQDIILVEAEARKQAEALLLKVEKENEELREKLLLSENRLRELEHRPPDPRASVGILQHKSLVSLHASHEFFPVLEMTTAKTTSLYSTAMCMCMSFLTRPPCNVSDLLFLIPQMPTHEWIPSKV